MLQLHDTPQILNRPNDAKILNRSLFQYFPDHEISGLLSFKEQKGIPVLSVP